MKQKFLFIISILLIIFTTGCTQIVQSITVNNDKSVDLVIIEAIDTSKLTNTEISNIKNELNLDKLEKAGYKLEDYKAGSYTGYKVTKHFNNIDKISTNEEIIADLAIKNITKQNYFFTVKKGLFKNTYYGDLYSSTIKELKSRTNNSNDTSYNYVIGTDNDTGFSLILPNSIKDNNAAYVSDDGKNSIWYTLDDEPIQFKFTLYNYKTIFIIITLFVIILFVILYKFFKKKRKKNLTLESYNSNSLF